MNDLTIVLNQKSDHPLLYALGQVVLILTAGSWTVSTFLLLSFASTESCSKRVSVVISILLTVILSCLCLLSKRIPITKYTACLALVFVLICFIGLKWTCRFTIEKWQNYPNLRPLMAQELQRATTKYSTSYDNISRQTHPNFLGLYSKEEIREIFASPKNKEGNEHITVILDVFTETHSYDVYFAYTDYDDTDFWMVATYCRTQDNDDFNKLVSIVIVPEGTVLDYSPEYVENS